MTTINNASAIEMAHQFIRFPGQQRVESPGKGTRNAASSDRGPFQHEPSRPLPRLAAPGARQPHARPLATRRDICRRSRCSSHVRLDEQDHIGDAPPPAQLPEHARLGGTPVGRCLDNVERHIFLAALAPDDPQPHSVSASPNGDGRATNRRNPCSVLFLSLTHFLQLAFPANTLLRRHFLAHPVSASRMPVMIHHAKMLRVFYRRRVTTTSLVVQAPVTHESILTL